MCNPAQVCKKYQRLCDACYRSCSDWTYFGPTHLSRATEYLDNAKERGGTLSDGLPEDYRPSTDCLCTRDDCVEQVVRKEHKRSDSHRTFCSVCRGQCRSSWRKVPRELVAVASSFFTTGKGAWRRKGNVECTGAWLTEGSSLCTMCRRLFYRHQKGGWNTSGTEETRLEDDSHCGEDAIDRAKVQIQQSTSDGRLITLDDALAMLAGERSA